VLNHANRRSDRGLRLTPVRRKTLEILLEQHRALGAYDVLERLAGSGFGNQPPVAYRALDFLVEHGLAHKINRLNAYAACMHPGHDHVPVFMICSACNTVAEDIGRDVPGAVDHVTHAAGFTADRVNVEVSGLCPDCRKGGGA
jgi:Fur family zinc uptake transcriptional regulator